MRRGEQMYMEPQAYFEVEEEGAAGDKKKGPAAATARQQRIACQGQPGKQFIRSDCGTKFLLVSTEVAAKGAANSGGAQFAEPKPYFAGV